MREKDQTFCPKCRRMYCEGYWGEGVCTADMHFSKDPTSRDDEIAEYVRAWYEINRETWWERCRFNRHAWYPVLADEFMLGFINEVNRVSAEAATQLGNFKKERP